jgi:DNA-binding CsgD family transcriptional regulator
VLVASAHRPLRYALPVGDRAHTLLVDGTPPLSTLRQEEAVLARLVARGLTDEEIAAGRGGTPEQVARDVAALCQRVGVTNRVQLATWVAVQEPGAVAQLRFGAWHPSLLDEVAPELRESVVKAIDILTDRFLDDVASLERGAGFDFDGTEMAAYLPRKYRTRYDRGGFARKFLVCLVVVGWKLRAPGWEPVACVAEELALRAILLAAEDIHADDHGVEGDFGDLWDAGFQDNDYELLFDPESDGVEDTEYAQRTGLTDIRFSAWFDGFNNTPPVHPYVEPDPAWWRRAPVVVEPDDEED